MEWRGRWVYGAALTVGGAAALTLPHGYAAASLAMLLPPGRRTAPFWPVVPAALLAYVLPSPGSLAILAAAILVAILVVLRGADRTPPFNILAAAILATRFVPDWYVEAGAAAAVALASMMFWLSDRRTHLDYAYWRLVERLEPGNPALAPLHRFWVGRRAAARHALEIFFPGREAKLPEPPIPENPALQVALSLPPALAVGAAALTGLGPEAAMILAAGAAAGTASPGLATLAPLLAVVAVMRVDLVLPVLAGLLVAAALSLRGFVEVAGCSGSVAGLCRDAVVGREAGRSIASAAGLAYVLPFVSAAVGLLVSAALVGLGAGRVAAAVAGLAAEYSVGGRLAPGASLAALLAF